jgi:hypothetical protein
MVILKASVMVGVVFSCAVLSMPTLARAQQTTAVAGETAQAPLESSRPEPLPGHPVGLLAAGIPVATVGLVLTVVGMFGATQSPDCSGGVCFDFRDTYLGVAVGGLLMFAVGAGLLIAAGMRWSRANRERERILRDRGELTLRFDVVPIQGGAVGAVVGRF